MELLPPRRSGPHNWAVSQRRRGSGLDAAGTRPGAERAEAPSTGGRPPARLVFNADAGVVLAAAIGRSRTQLGVCNLAGEVLTMADFDQEIGIGPNDLMPDIAKRLEALLDDIGRRLDEVLGVGLSIPGTADTCATRSRPERATVAGVPFDGLHRVGGVGVEIVRRRWSASPGYPVFACNPAASMPATAQTSSLSELSPLIPMAPRRTSLSWMSTPPGTGTMRPCASVFTAPMK